jgi:hypothetical protein
MDFTNYGSNFKGTIENILIYNTELSAVDVSNDNSAPLGLAIASNLVSRHLMTADYNEGTPCNPTTPTVTPYGMEVTFGDGNLSNPSYVKGDYYNCFKSKYSLIKDNVSTFDLEILGNSSGLYTDVITSPIDGTNVIPANDTVITTKAYFGQQEKKDVPIAGCYSASVTSKYSSIFQTSLNSDYSVEWTHTYGLQAYWFKIGSPAALDATEVTDTGDKVGFRFHANGTTIKRVTNTGVETDLATTFTVGDKFKVDYVNATSDITLSKWDGSSWVSLSVTNVPSITLIGSLFSTAVQSGIIPIGFAIQDCNVTYLHPKEYMLVGDKTTSTGAYNPSFCGSEYTILEGVDDSVRGSVRFESNSVLNTNNFLYLNHFTVSTYYKEYMNKENPVVVGNCDFHFGRGFVRFSTADVGKTITCSRIFSINN